MSKTQPHPGHERHLCKLVADKTSTEKLKPLVKDSKYICKDCGRTAAKAENLCSPEKI
jgi:transposase-like protein